MTGRYGISLAAACIASAAVVLAAEPQERIMDLHGQGFKELRDPFWPLGYQPVTESEQMERTKIADLKTRINWPTLPLRGVTHAGGKKFIAVIKRVGLVEAGDVVTIREGALTYRWRIDNVSSEGIVSTRLDVTETPGVPPAPVK